MAACTFGSFFEGLLVCFWFFPCRTVRCEPGLVHLMTTKVQCRNDSAFRTVRYLFASTRLRGQWHAVSERLCDHEKRAAYKLSSVKFLVVVGLLLLEIACPLDLNGESPNAFGCGSHED